MKCDVINLDSKSVGSVDLAEAIFGLEVREDILHRVVRWQLAKRQSGNHKTKTVGEVSGSNKKPFNQKGTGRARQGDKKAPHMRGGGVAFGPLVRSHAFKMPRKVRALALRTALSAKQADGKLIILSETKTKSAKTADLVKQVKKLGWDSALIIDGAEVDQNFGLAARNIKGIDILPQQGANVYDILRCDTLVLTKDAVEKLVERLK